MIVERSDFRGEGRGVTHHAGALEEVGADGGAGYCAGGVELDLHVLA